MKTAVLIVFTAAGLSAQRPQIENAKLETRPSSGALAGQLAQFGPGPFWAGYSEPIVSGHHGNMCNSNQMSDAPVRLEGQTALTVLIRMTSGRTDELKLVSPDCRIDAGGLPFYWIENVPPAESVAWLKANASNSAITAIALHAGGEADRVMEELTALTQPERVREKAAFWLGVTRGARGVEVLSRMLTSDPSQKVREQVVFGLSQSKEASALKLVFEAARSDKDPHIRGKALFWLAQKAGNAQALEEIRNAVTADPERSVKEQAVFALKQLPNNEGIPALINVAKTHADPAIRKKAMFWLGQSNDPRAVDFFAQVLKQ